MHAQMVFGAVIGLGLTGCPLASEDDDWEEGHFVRARVTADADLDHALAVLTPRTDTRVSFTQMFSPPGKVVNLEHEEVLPTLFDRLIVIGFRGDVVIGAAISAPLEYEHTDSFVAFATTSLKLDQDASVEVFGTPADCVRVTVGTATIVSTRSNDADCDGEPDPPSP